MKSCVLGALGLVATFTLSGCSKSGTERVAPTASATAPAGAVTPPAPKSVWPAEPVPALASETALLAAAKAELEAKGFKALLDPKAPRAKRDTFLRDLGQGIAGLDPKFAKLAKAVWTASVADRNKIFAEMGKDVEHAKSLFAVLMCVLVEGKLSDEIANAAKERIAEDAAKPHAGLWSKTHDLTALAVYLHPGNATYLRELVAARASDATIDWEGSADAYRPWLSRERDALQLLSQVTTLNEAETERLNEIRASKLGDTIEKVDLDELLATYKSNEVRGDDKFKGHSVQVRGTVHEIAKDAFGNTFLRMGSARLIGGFHCKMNPAFLKQASKVDGGSTATVRGKVVGLVLKNVVAGDCEVK
jgi:tRNA_anti-like